MKRDGQFYSADSFQVYNVQAHDHRSAINTEYEQGNFPVDNHIYVAVAGDKMYSTTLQHQHKERSHAIPFISWNIPDSSQAVLGISKKYPTVQKYRYVFDIPRYPKIS